MKVREALITSAVLPFRRLAEPAADCRVTGHAVARWLQPLSQSLRVSDQIIDTERVVLRGQACERAGMET